MPFTHTQTRRVRTAGGTLARSITKSSSGTVETSITVSDGVSDSPIFAAVDPASLQSFYMVSSRDVSVTTNDLSQSFALTAGVPRMWDVDSAETFFLTAAVLVFYVTNASGAAAEIELRVLHNAAVGSVSQLTERTAGELLAASSFVPSDLSGLKVWLETGDYHTIRCHEHLTNNDPCEDGEVCLRWQDQAPTPLNLSEATNGPTYQRPSTIEATTPRGKGRLEFDGTNDVLTGASAADWKFLHDGTGCEIHVVMMASDEESACGVDTTAKLTGVGALLWVDDDAAAEGRAGWAARNGSGVIFNIQAASAGNVMPVAEWHDLAGNYVTGTDPQLWVDGCFIASATPSGAASASNPAQALKLGQAFDASFGTNKYAAIIAYSRVLTVAERRQLTGYLSSRYGFAAGNVACIGDSITSGADGTGNYPSRLAELLGGLWRVTSLGVSGAVVNEAGAAADLYNDQWLHTTAGVKRRRYNWCVCLGGINDIRNTADSAATIFARYDDMLDEIVAEPGMRMILCTLLPAGNADTWDSVNPDQARLEAYNALIEAYVAAHPTNTYLVDLYAALGDSVDPTVIRAVYDLDGLHPNENGMNVIAAAIADKIQEVGLL